MLQDFIYDTIKLFYNKFSKYIISIYLTGSRIIPFLEPAATDYDFFILVNSNRSKNKIIKYLDGNTININGYKIDFRLWSVSEFNKYKISGITKWYDYQFHFMDNEEPIFGKKLVFKSRLDDNKVEYIKAMLYVTEVSYINYIKKYGNQSEFFPLKMFYHILLWFYILINNSYTSFTKKQIDDIKKAKDCMFTTNDVYRYLTTMINPTLHKLLAD